MRAPALELELGGPGRRLRCPKRAQTPDPAAFPCKLAALGNHDRASMAIADPLAGTLRGRPHSVAFAAHVGKNASKTASAGRLQEPASRKEEVESPAHAKCHVLQTRRPTGRDGSTLTRAGFAVKRERDARVPFATGSPTKPTSSLRRSRGGGRRKKCDKRLALDERTICRRNAKL